MTATTAPAPAAVTRSPGARPAAGTLTGLAATVRLVLRRNRIRLAVCWVSLVGLPGHGGGPGRGGSRAVRPAGRATGVTTGGDTGALPSPGDHATPTVGRWGA